MLHEMRAEEGSDPRKVKLWHMVRENEHEAMCGHALEPGSARQSDRAWGATTEPFCHTCGALYLREVP